jgi:hypothetical protein
MNNKFELGDIVFYIKDLETVKVGKITSIVGMNRDLNHSIENGQDRVYNLKQNQIFRSYEVAKQHIIDIKPLLEQKSYFYEQIDKLNKQIEKAQEFND